MLKKLYRKLSRKFPFVQKLLRALSVFLVVLFFLAIGFILWLQDKYVVPILMYHNVDYVEKPVANNTSPGNFAWQMDFLKKNKYHVISLDELVKATQNGRQLPRRSVVITFDDGYEDNYVNAFKILKQRGFPAIIFCITNTIGQSGYLTWDQIREMERFGVVAGSHTVVPVYLPGTPEEKQRFQIWESKRVLEERLRHPVDYFAYPSGGFSEKIKKLIREAGYKGACTTNRGYDRLNQDVYELNRIRPGDKDTPMSLRFKLSGFNNYFKKTVDPY